MGLNVRRLAATAPPAVLALAGGGGSRVVADLRADPTLDIVNSPRHASLVLGVGDFPGTLGDAAAQVHDQLPLPRAAAWLPITPGLDQRPAIPGLEVLDQDAVVPGVVDLHRSVVSGERASSPDVLPDVDPNEWRCIGPFGQGGKGMTGGVPYGRPLTGRAPDRDGLELDQLSVRLGPWLSSLPAGLLLDLRLQGDVVQEVEVGASPFRARPPADLFTTAMHEPVPIAELELMRAAHHLRWAAGVLRLLGLRTLATRLDRAALDPMRAGPLAGNLARARRLRPPMAGLGVVTGHHASSIGGPVARAAGEAIDLRTDDPAYMALGFEPALASGGDAWARWILHLEEAARSVGLAARAGGRHTTPAEVVESPRGPIGADHPAPSAGLLAMLGGLLPGLEWSDAPLAIASLDIDVEEAAARAEVPA